MPSVDVLRRYAVVDPADDTAILELCLNAATDYFRGAGVKDPIGDMPLYDLGIYMLATHYYDNRGAMGDPAAALPYGVNSIINQLRV